MLLACRSGCVETVRTLHHLNATIFVKQLGRVQVKSEECRDCTAHACSMTGEHEGMLHILVLATGGYLVTFQR